MYIENAKQFLAEIDKSPSCFHVIKNMKEALENAGFEKLSESRSWNLVPGHSYYVTRNNSSVIAFRLPEGGFGSFNIMASHSDSPVFKIKENPEMAVEGRYVKLNVEKYGGMLCAPWFDRPLSVAGRLMVRDGNGIRTVLVNVDRDFLMIPNLAIHMNRAANEGYRYNPQTDMLPLMGGGDAGGSFGRIVAEAAGVREKDIAGADLFLYNRQKGCIWGAGDEFISAPRLDDLECAYSSLAGIINCRAEKTAIPVHMVLDNEEVGSGTKQGAASTFLMDTLTRIVSALGGNHDNYLRALASSFMVSADNAHALHPNHADKTDPTNRPFMNDGIVIKHNANQKYTTDAVSCAVMKTLCEKAGVKYQMFANRSDMAGGSTLGNISNTHVALNTADIGLAQLAMHSPYETAGIRDLTDLMKLAETFFSSAITAEDDGNYIID